MVLNGPLNVLRLMQIRRFTHLTNAFCKKWENLKVALARISRTTTFAESTDR